ncbi:putative transcription factor bZIP family [Helianthus anomalus]
MSQTREAARKSRLRKKAYVQQLETCRLKLVQLEQELERSRQQGACGCLLNTSNGISSSNINSERKRDNELKIMLQNQVSEPDLRISVDSSLNHCYELFQMKANATKADVFYFMYGMWRTPIERLFQ